jgi:hypothetical protein
MNINDCHKINRYGYTSYWYIKPEKPDRVFLKEQIDREDFHIVGEIDGYYEYRITNDLINALGASAEYVMTANGYLEFVSIWDYDNNRDIYWATDLDETPYEVIAKVELEPEPWWDAHSYYRGKWIKEFCREWDLEEDIEEDGIKKELGEDIVEDMEIVKVHEMRGGDSLFWNWTKGKQPRLFSLIELTYPENIEDVGSFVTISEGRGQEKRMYKAFEYAVTPDVLSVYARVNKKVVTPAGDIIFYVARDNGSRALEDTDFYYWAVGPDGNVLGTYYRWISDNEDLNWHARITKQFCSEPAVTV